MNLKRLAYEYQKQKQESRKNAIKEFKAALKAPMPVQILNIIFALLTGLITAWVFYRHVGLPGLPSLVLGMLLGPFIGAACFLLVLSIIDYIILIIALKKK